MSFTVNFYTFAKKVNSTAQPGSGAVPATCELKASTSVITPVLVTAGILNPSVFNYCHINEFDRYYFINDWTYENGRWFATCKVDVLASYKTAVGASSQYVLRSASASDGTIDDVLYPVINSIDIQHSEVTTNRPLTADINSGFYVCGIIAQNGSIGCVNYYIFTQAQFDTLKNALFSDISWASVSDVSADLLKTMFNPYDYIVSCKWCPITSLATLVSTTDVTSINLGWWQFTCNAKKLTNNSYTYVGWGFDIAKSNFGNHPQVSRGTYLNGGRYAEYNMNIAPYGCIHIPAESALVGVSCNEWIDIITGECTLKVFAGSGGSATVAPLICVESVMLVDIQLAQVKTSGVEGLAAAAVQAIAGNDSLWIDKGGPIQSATSGIASAIREQNTTIKVGGANGGFAKLAQFANFKAVITSIFHRIASEDNSHLGRPLCATRTINTLSGYFICADPEISITGTETESNEILAFMTSGMFYE